MIVTTLIIALGAACPAISLASCALFRAIDTKLRAAEAAATVAVAPEARQGALAIDSATEIDIDATAIVEVANDPSDAVADSCYSAGIFEIYISSTERIPRGITRFRIVLDEVSNQYLRYLCNHPGGKINDSTIVAAFKLVLCLHQRNWRNPFKLWYENAVVDITLRALKKCDFDIAKACRLLVDDWWGCYRDFQTVCIFKRDSPASIEEMRYLLTVTYCRRRYVAPKYVETVAITTKPVNEGTAKTETDNAVSAATSAPVAEISIVERAFLDLAASVTARAAEARANTASTTEFLVRTSNDREIESDGLLRQYYIYLTQHPDGNLDASTIDTMFKLVRRLHEFNVQRPFDLLNEIAVVDVAIHALKACNGDAITAYYIILPDWFGVYAFFKSASRRASSDAIKRMRAVVTQLVSFTTST